MTRGLTANSGKGGGRQDFVVKYTVSILGFLVVDEKMFSLIRNITNQNDVRVYFYTIKGSSFEPLPICGVLKSPQKKRKKDRKVKLTKRKIRKNERQDK